MGKISVLVRRAIRLDGETLSPGEHRVSLAQAADIVDGLRVALADPRDSDALESARRCALAATLRELRTPPAVPEAGPWRTVGEFRVL